MKLFQFLVVAILLAYSAIVCAQTPDGVPPANEGICDAAHYGCHSCVEQICAIDSTCCELEFDTDCLDMVDTVCGLVCE